MKKIRVLIAEDHAVVRQGLKILIAEDPQLEIAGEAGTSEEALKVAQQVQPDVVIMDVAMPRQNGMEATRGLLERQPETKVLVLSSYTDHDTVAQMVKAGAAGYVTKHSASADLLEAIKQVHRGHAYFSPAIASRLRRRAARSVRGLEGLLDDDDLTEREKQVLKLIAEGMPNKQVAATLRLSLKTVEKHRQQVMRKLDLHDTASLTRYAAAKGYVPLLFPSQVGQQPLTQRCT